MKTSLLLLTMMVAGCSTDRSEGLGPPLHQSAGEDIANQTSDASAEKENSGTVIASNGNVAVPVEQRSDAGPNSPAPSPAPQSTVEAEKITPPNQVTGAYLTATILPRANANDPLRVGLSAMKDNQRIGPDRTAYQTNWQMSFEEAVAYPVKLLPSSLAAYDQVIEFYGSSAEFKQYAGSIKVYLQVTEMTSKLNSLVDGVLSDLVEGQTVPEAAAIDEEAPAEEVETPPEAGEEDDGLTEAPAPKPTDGLTEVGPKK